MVWLVHEATPEQLAWLRSIGVTKVLLALPNFQVPDIITRCHQAGLKVVARWPEWKQLELNTEQYSFRNYLREKCPFDDEDTAGPSYWCPIAHKEALKSMRRYKELSLDGILVAPRYSDVPYPHFWEAVARDQNRYNTQYWCHDDWAIEDWKQNGFSGNPPTHATLNEDGTVDPDPTFYQWYQGAWKNRLYVLTKCALENGFTDLYTWHLPLSAATLENVSLGTYRSEHIYQGWVDQCQLAQASPTLISACLFGAFHSQRTTAIAEVERLSSRHGWSMMVGAEVCHSSESVLPSLVTNGLYAKERGWSLFGSGRYLFDQNNTHALSVFVPHLLTTEKTEHEDLASEASVCESAAELSVPDLPTGPDVCGSEAGDAGA